MGTYIDLYPLDGAITTPSQCFNRITTVYKAINIKTGKTVCLRRVHSFTLTKNGLDKNLLMKIKEWKQTNHSNIVKFYEVFITKEFGDNSLVFVYDFHPASKTLLAQYYFNSNTSFSSKVAGSAVNRPYSQQQQAQRQKLLPEPHIWSYIIQLLSALRAIHPKGLVARIVDVKKILIGDIQQLSPVIKNKEVSGKGYDQSLMLHLAALCNKSFMLSLQYRMHPQLSRFSRE